jgi:hypothetical protein
VQVELGGHNHPNGLIKGSANGQTQPILVPVKAIYGLAGYCCRFQHVQGARHSHLMAVGGLFGPFVWILAGKRKNMKAKFS